MTESRTIPRDDRTWGPGAFPLSLFCVLLSGVGLAFALASARSDGRLTVTLLVVLVLCGLETFLLIRVRRPWLAGGSAPRWVTAAQVGVLLAIVVSFGGGGAMGSAALCTFFVTVFALNASTLRLARDNRALVDQAEARLALERLPEEEQRQREPLRPAHEVGGALRQTLREDRSRSVAWVVALVLAAAGGATLAPDTGALFGIVFVGLWSVVWVGRQAVGVWLALRDFEKAATPPRRAFVVLLHDPAPKMIRPLLGVWSTEPVPVGGRVPRPEAVYRCDDAREALLSFQDHAVVHEAWVDTGRWERSRPSWVVADAGLALPHRRSVLGRIYLGSLIGRERPGRARRLTTAAPHPSTERSPLVAEGDAPLAGWLRMLAVRFAWLAAVGVLFALVA